MYYKAIAFRRLHKDPLVHFIVAGIVFILLSLVRPLQQDDRIVADRQALLSFIQYRNKAFEPALAASMLDRMNRDERGRLIHDYIREEALYRDAMKLGLKAENAGFADATRYGERFLFHKNYVERT